MNITYSIVAPIYNEIDNLPELYRRVKEVMDANGEPWGFILVDDGSTDGSTEKIRELAEKEKTVRPVIFARNFGHQIAITAGWDYARGDAVVFTDADLQDPPEVILDLAKWKEGYEVVLVDVGYDKHYRIKKSAHFASKGVHINGIEAFWSFTKRRLTKFNGVKTNFELHLKDCEWRYSKSTGQLVKELRTLITKNKDLMV